MLKCIFIKRRLYDYLDNSLSEIERMKVEAHLGRCNKCGQSLKQLKIILDAASRKKAPQPNDEFWHDFKIDLGRKLNEKLVPDFSLKQSLGYRLRPAFSFALILIFILAVGNYFLKNPHPASLRLAQDDDLVEEADALDAIDEVSEFDYQDEPYEELNLLYKLDEV